MTAPLSRRQALAGAAAAGVGVPVLAACASSSGTGAGGTGDGGGTTTPPPAGDTLVATSDVPVGGGVILSDQQIVVTQPSAGQFAAFSAICTHLQCVVGSVTDGEIVCPCHGSHFSIADGSVTGGPAPSPLPEVTVRVKGGEVVTG